MRSFTSDQLRNALIQLVISKGDILFIHSSLLSLGLIDAADVNSQSTEILKILGNILCKEGTVAVPTFNFDFCIGIPFSKELTKSKKMGVFSEEVRTHPDAIRSSHPMQSIAAIGHHAKTITANDTSTAFSNGGSFDIMRKLGAKLVFLGANVQSAALIHLVEEELNVPYRYFKEFTGDYSLGIEPPVKKSYAMFVRSEILEPKLSLKILENCLISEGKLKSVKLGMGTIATVDFRDFMNTATNLVKNDPFILLENKNEVYEKYNLSIK